MNIIKSDINVIYIAGNGHSGSTLLDIVLGSNELIFSAGELTFICRDRIFEEYCSCGSTVLECMTWQDIIRVWQADAKITIKEYKRLRLKYERNKVSIRTLGNKIFPSDDFVKYCDSTKILFESISKVTGNNTIVDSSKSPQRIAILHNVVQLKVIHLCRNFSGVLNSAKKGKVKDIKKGIEEDVYPKSTFKSLFDWGVTNALTEVFCLGVDSRKLFYNQYIDDVSIVSKLIGVEIMNHRPVYFAEHMIAGNALRLKRDIIIDKTIGNQHERLSRSQKTLAFLVEKLFFFWTKKY